MECQRWSSEPSLVAFMGLLRHTKGKEEWRDGNDDLGHPVRWLEGSDWSQPFSLARKPHLKSCNWVKHIQPGLQLMGKVTSWHLSQKGHSLYPQTRNTAVFTLLFTLGSCLLVTVNGILLRYLLPLHKVTTPFPNTPVPNVAILPLLTWTITCLHQPLLRFSSAVFALQQKDWKSLLVQPAQDERQHII